MDQRKLFGFDGETLAARFYQESGFQIVARNWTCLFGELDLIVEKGDIVVFVEVKSRRSDQTGFPEESVNRAKLRHLRRCIDFWLSEAKITPKHFYIEVCAIRFFCEVEPEIVRFEVWD